MALRRPSSRSKRASSMWGLELRRLRASCFATEVGTRELEIQRPAREGAEGRGAEEGRCARGEARPPTAPALRSRQRPAWRNRLAKPPEGVKCTVFDSWRC